MISEMDVLQAERFTPADEKDSAHGKGFLIHEEQREPYPQGFFRAIAKNGLPAGFGFSCWKCHLQIPSGAPSSVRHCNRVEVLNENFELPTHVIGSGTTYRAVTDAEIVNAVSRVEQKHIVDHMLDPTPTIFDRGFAWVRNLLR